MIKATGLLKFDVADAPELFPEGRKAFECPSHPFHKFFSVELEGGNIVGLSYELLNNVVPEIFIPLGKRCYKVGQFTLIPVGENDTSIFFEVVE